MKQKFTLVDCLQYVIHFIFGIHVGGGINALDMQECKFCKAVRYLGC